MGTIKAVILAAGRGSRLMPYTESMPKSLFEVAPGVTITDFIINRLQAVKVDEIIIATRPELTEKFESRFGGRVRVVAVNGEDFGNLYTLKTAVDGVKADKILVCMSDHLFERSLLTKLLRSNSEKAVILCLDRDPSWEKAVEGLKVELGRDGIRRVGKKLPPFDGVDTGLFLLSQRAFDMINEVIEAKGPNSNLSDLVNYAAELGEVAYVDVTGKLWMDVDTPEDLVNAREMYWKIIKRELVRPTDGPISRYINRPISTRISILLYRSVHWLSANHVSVISFLTALLSAALFVTGYMPLAGISAHIASILDGVDGELARLRGEESVWGGFLDTVLDRFADIAIITALGFLALKLPYMNTALALLVTALAAFGVVMVSYVTKVSAECIDVHELRNGFPWATRDVRLFTVTLGGLLGMPLIPLVFCAIVPIIFSLKAFILHEKDVRKIMKTQKARPLRPLIKNLKGEVEEAEQFKRKIKTNLTELISNGLKLAVALALIRFLAYTFGGIEISVFEILRTSVSQLLSAVNLLAIIYFGYKVILSLKFFLELASSRFVRSLGITGTAYRKVVMDILYLSAISMVWVAVSPIVRQVHETFYIIKILVGSIFLAAFVLIFYDLIKIFRRNLKGIWNRVIDRLSEAVSSYVQEPLKRDLEAFDGA